MRFLGDELARRTFDESGHYYVKPYQCASEGISE